MMATSANNAEGRVGRDTCIPKSLRYRVRSSELKSKPSPLLVSTEVAISTSSIMYITYLIWALLAWPIANRFLYIARLMP